MKPSRISIIAVAILLAVPRFTLSREVSIQLPPDTAAFRQSEGMPLAQALCVQCHSADYLAIQPVMTAKFWDAEVKKMRDKYGAPVPPELDAQLVAYLVKAYGKP